MKRHPLARPLDAVLDSAPDVYAGLSDALLSVSPAYARRLLALRPAEAADLVAEAVAYHESMRGSWESTPDGIAAWLIAQELLIDG